MTTSKGQNRSTSDDQSATSDTGLLNFPTAPAECSTCRSADCPHRACPDLTPRTARMLLLAGAYLAEQVRNQVLHSPRPVYLYHVARTFDVLCATLSRGRRPHPATPAEHLCLYLMIVRARGLAKGNQNLVDHLPRSRYDHDYARLLETLLTAHSTYEPLVEIGSSAVNPGAPFDFLAVSDAMTPHGMSGFFAAVEPDPRVA